jgi:hypothetical protein
VPAASLDEAAVAAAQEARLQADGIRARVVKVVQAPAGQRRAQQQEAVVEPRAGEQ